MGIKKLPSYKDYWWSSDKVIKRYLHSIHNMQESFEWFLSHFHVNVNSKLPPRNDHNCNKLHKTHPLIEMLSKTCKHTHKLTEVQSIDESMIKIKLTFYNF